MNSPRRRPGAVPAAFARDGREVPASPDVAEATLAGVIGEAVGLHLAKILGPVLHQLGQAQSRPGCLRCATEVKRTGKAYEIAVANALAAAEPLPEAPEVHVTESFTDGARGPVCWAHFDPDADGPVLYDFEMPAPVD